MGEWKGEGEAKTSQPHSQRGNYRSRASALEGLDEGGARSSGVSGQSAVSEHLAPNGTSGQTPVLISQFGSRIRSRMGQLLFLEVPRDLGLELRLDAWAV